MAHASGSFRTWLPPSLAPAFVPLSAGKPALADEILKYGRSSVLAGLSQSPTKDSRRKLSDLGRPSSLHGGAPPLINGQPNKCRSEQWRGETVFQPAFYKIAKNTVHLDRRLFFEIAIHGRGQRRTRGSKLTASFFQECLRERIATSTRDCGAFAKYRER